MVKNYMYRKGFTLIEMLVVIAIISILAGVVLTGVGGFQANARDTKRVGDMKIVQNYIEQYYSRNTKYPLVTATGSSNWSALQTALTSGGISVKLPNDPQTGKFYLYGTKETADPTTAYMIQANLETSHSALNAPQTYTSSDLSGWSQQNGIDCATASKHYCVGSGS